MSIKFKKHSYMSDRYKKRWYIQGVPKKADTRLVCRVSAFLDHPVDLLSSVTWILELHIIQYRNTEDNLSTKTS